MLARLKRVGRNGSAHQLRANLLVATRCANTVGIALAVESSSNLVEGPEYVARAVPIASDGILFGGIRRLDKDFLIRVAIEKTLDKEKQIGAQDLAQQDGQ